jgi:hypothetical protein
MYNAVSLDNILCSFKREVLSTTNIRNLVVLLCSFLAHFSLLDFTIFPPMEGESLRVTWWSVVHARTIRGIQELKVLNFQLFSLCCEHFSAFMGFKGENFVNL